MIWIWNPQNDKWVMTVGCFIIWFFVTCEPGKLWEEIRYLLYKKNSFITLNIIKITNIDIRYVYMLELLPMLPTSATLIRGGRMKIVEEGVRVGPCHQTGVGG